MGMSVKRRGVVVSVDGSMAKVLIDRGTACSSCKISDACNKTECDSMVVEARIATSRPIAHGDVVCVSSGGSPLLSVLIGYGLPLVLLLVVCVLVGMATGSDAAAAVTGLASIACYYALLFCLRARVGRMFALTVT